LWRIRDYVKDGGAFLMVGGPKSFSEGRYQGTEITEVLPFDLPPSYGGGESLDLARFSPVVTPAGRAHPITQLSIDPATNDALWASLPELEGLNKASRLKPGAVSLLDHPTVRGDDGLPSPVVAAYEAGEGRVLTVNTDTTWLWSTLGASDGAGGGLSPYTEFWTNAIRWLIRDPDLELVRIAPPEAPVKLGETARIDISVFGVDYRASPQHNVQVVVERRGSVRDASQTVKVFNEQELRTNEAGQISISPPTVAPGVYEVRAQARIGERLAKARQVYLVVNTNPELETTVPALDYLALLAEASRGRVVSPGDTLDLDLRSAEVTQLVERSEKPLWSGADILVLAALLLGGEWWLRRRYGFL
jgi:hypothetical protein